MQSSEREGESLEVEMKSLHVSLQIKYSIPVCYGCEKAIVILGAMSENTLF